MIDGIPALAAKPSTARRGLSRRLPYVSLDTPHLTDTAELKVVVPDNRRFP